MSAQKPEGDQLEQLGRKLYSRDFPDISNLPPPVLPPDESSAPRRWEGTEGLYADSLEAARTERGFPFKTILIASLIFFVLCAGVAAAVVYHGLNTVSADNIDISFLGPVSIAAGNELDFTVVVQNNNNVPMSGVQLYLDYPDGTKEALNLSTSLSHEGDPLPDIPAGGSTQYDAKAVLFGAEHATEEIDATVQYSVPNNNAVFKKEKPYDVEISSAPLSMSVNGPSQTAAAAPVEFSVTLTPNSVNALGNILLTASYPFGFQFASSTPAPTYGQSEWLFPALAGSSSVQVTIVGRLQGQENDQQTLRFLAGTQSTLDPKNIDLIYLSQNQTVAINRSPVDVELALNNQNSQNGSGNFVISPGNSSGNITLTNNLPTELLNAQVSVVLAGPALDPASVSPGENGLYRQDSQTITWDKISAPALAQISPGQALNLDFSFNSLSVSQLQALQNGDITFAVSVTGTEQGAASNAAALAATTQGTARLASSVGLVAHAVYSTGPFRNSGPVPPVVDTPTTYTVLWTLTNTSNIVSGGTVTATLPAYVHWIGTVSPTTANVTFNANNNTVTWTPGDLPASGSSPVASVAFQVQILPMASQVGSAPDLVDNISFSGTDSFVNAPVTASTGYLSTAITTDPNYGTQNGFVVQ